MKFWRARPGRMLLRVVVLDAIAFLLFGLSFVSTATAQNTLRVMPAQSAAVVSGPDIALELEIDFSEVTVGGGVEVTYDASRLEFVSFVFSGDPFFGLSGPADGDATQPIIISAGWFITESPFGVSGLHTIGTFTFRPIGSGSASVTPSESPINPGPYFSPSSSMPLVVVYQEATIDIGVAPAVPAMGAFGRLVCCALLLAIAIRMVNPREMRGGSPPGFGGIWG